MRWINARAGLDRAEEELMELVAEMGMIHKGYKRMARKWEKKARKMAGHPAHVAMAREKEDIWLEFAARAKEQFSVTVPGVVQ